jgi:mannonate dehydratase
MRLGTVLTPINHENLLLAAQCGVTDLVARYPGNEPGALRATQRQAAEYGLTVSVVEGYLPIERMKLGQDDGTERSAMQRLIKEMSDLGITLLCYNFMPGTDWVRTDVARAERGGAVVTAFRLADALKAVSLSPTAPRMAPTTGSAAAAGGGSGSGAGPGSTATVNSVHTTIRETTGGPQPSTHSASALSLPAEQLWQHLQRFLDDLLPHAERAGVTLCMHPDDPPLPSFDGRARIMNSVASFERLMQLAPSPNNKICFCQGSFATMGVDIPAAIRQLGPHIRYVHFRDVRGTPEDFAETFHDNGPTDMVAAMQAYREVGFDGPIRPDHVPQFVGEIGEPGYTMLGRLFAYGYLRGLMQATDPSR